jgi:hypothetical protein
MNSGIYYILTPKKELCMKNTIKTLMLLAATVGTVNFVNAASAYLKNYSKHPVHWRIYTGTSLIEKASDWKDNVPPVNPNGTPSSSEIHSGACITKVHVETGANRQNKQSWKPRDAKAGIHCGEVNIIVDANGVAREA